MTPYYGYAKGTPFFYYDCTKRRHTGKRECQMNPVPAKPLEDLIAQRLIHLNQNQALTINLIQNAFQASCEMVEDLSRGKNSLVKKLKEITRKIDALVESITTNKLEVKSITQKIIQLEEQKEQLDEEILNIDPQIGEAKKKSPMHPNYRTH